MFSTLLTTDTMQIKQSFHRSGENDIKKWKSGVLWRPSCLFKQPLLLPVYWRVQGIEIWLFCDL